MLTTELSFVVPDTSTVIMKVYDNIGNLIATPVNEKKPAGALQCEILMHIKHYQKETYSYKVVAGNIVKNEENSGG